MNWVPETVHQKRHLCAPHSSIQSPLPHRVQLSWLLHMLCEIETETHPRTLSMAEMLYGPGGVLTRLPLGANTPRLSTTTT